MREIKKAVSKFWVEYGLYDKNLTLDYINDILRSQGFIVVSFGTKNPNEVQEIIDSLDVARECEEHDSFTYCSGKARAVFINKSLNDADKLAVLMHEEGHIFLEHFSHSGIIEHTHTKHENEANVFALLLMRKIRQKNFYQYLNSLVSRISPLSVKIFIISLVMFGFSIYNLSQYVSQKTDDSPSDVPTATSTQSDITDIDSHFTVDDNADDVFYWTAQGTVYHIYLDCQHIRNSKNVLSGSPESSGKSRCCSTCKARRLKDSSIK